MVPLLVTRSEGRRLFPMPNSKRRSHSFVFDLSQVEASGPWSRFVREAYLSKKEEKVLRAAMWLAYLSWYTDWERCWTARLYPWVW